MVRNSKINNSKYLLASISEEIQEDWIIVPLIRCRFKLLNSALLYFSRDYLNLKLELVFLFVRLKLYPIIILICRGNNNLLYLLFRM